MFRSTVACLFAASVLFFGSHVAASDGFTRGIFPRPDLKMEPVGGSPCQTRYFQFKVVNVGKVPAGAFVVLVYTGGRKNEYTVPRLAVGESWSYAGFSNNTAMGFSAIADWNNHVDESDERNNVIQHGCPR